MTAPRLSVVIPAYRAERTLPRVLKALAPQVDRPDREVVVVDSTGGQTAAHLERAWPWLRAVGLPDRTLPGRARNLGVSVTRGELLAFLDADTVPEPDWLDELERALGPGAEAVGGAILDGTPGEPWGSVGYTLEFLEWLPSRRPPIGHAASCNLLIRRDVLERAGGFPEDLWPGEDTVLTVPLAQRGTLAFAPRAKVTHLNRTERRAVLAHQRRLGASFVELCDREPVRGARLAVPHLAPLAVLARFASLVFQLLRGPEQGRGAMRQLPRLACGLLAWGTGVAGAGRRSSPRARRPNVDETLH